MRAMESLTALLLMVMIIPLEAQFGMPPKPRKSPIKGDLPAIKCQACHALIDNVYGKVAEMRETAPFGKHVTCKECTVVITRAERMWMDRARLKQRLGLMSSWEHRPAVVHEDDISSLVEGACDPSKPDGRWISEIDIVGGSDRYLEFHKPGGMSHCKEECETIAKSCSSLVNDELDIEELVVALWKNQLELEAFREVACKEWSERCSGKPVKAPKDRMDFEFQEKSSRDVEMDDLMATLQASGLGGSMGPGMQAYSPDDLEAMRDMMGDMDMDGLGDMMGDYGGGMDDGFEF